MAEGILISLPRARTGFLPLLLELPLARGKKNCVLWKGNEDKKEDGKREILHSSTLSFLIAMEAVGPFLIFSLSPSFIPQAVICGCD